MQHWGFGELVLVGSGEDKPRPRGCIDGQGERKGLQMKQVDWMVDLRGHVETWGKIFLEAYCRTEKEDQAEGRCFLHLLVGWYCFIF